MPCEPPSLETSLFSSVQEDEQHPLLHLVLLRTLPFQIRVLAGITHRAREGGSHSVRLGYILSHVIKNTTTDCEHEELEQCYMVAIPTPIDLNTTYWRLLRESGRICSSTQRTATHSTNGDTLYDHTTKTKPVRVILNSKPRDLTMTFRCVQSSNLRFINARLERTNNGLVPI